MLLTSADCLKTLGDPTTEKSMTLWVVPKNLIVGRIPSRIYCNKRMVEPLSRAFNALIETGSINELRSWDGCFNIRKKRGGTSQSLHSWGLAIDVNASTNKFGEKSSLTTNFIECFTENGFDWGGLWAKPDGMHFQLKRDEFFKK